MKKLEKNREIVAEIRGRLKDAGLEDVLDVFPVENSFTRRPRFWVDSDGVALFKVLMWDLNPLDKESLDAEIDRRIRAARRHFNL